LFPIPCPFPHRRPFRVCPQPGCCALGAMRDSQFITDYIYLGNLNAAYSGRALCTNGIDNIIDMSSLPSDHSLSIIPCTSLMEKGKRVLIHCRDGYSLGPTCVIQYLMVKHSMRLLAAYELLKVLSPNVRKSVLQAEEDFSWELLFLRVQVHIISVSGGWNCKIFYGPS
uniref:protein-tyrosine-phosphatase n=1 Tax=Coturnix japonica TaxID=93934 RepID=A0A8C2U9S8_COTJA